MVVRHKHEPIRLTSLWRELANETASWCGTSAAQDYKKLLSRVEAEGESFLTITLPQFGKDFERSLELGSVGPGLFRSFAQRKGGLPRFLGGFLDQIFDSSGTLLDTPSVDCILAVRQLTLVFGKIFRVCSDARVRSAMRSYVELEQELEAFDYGSLEEYLPQFRKASTLLWGDVFSQVEAELLGLRHLELEWVEHSHQPFRDPSLPSESHTTSDCWSGLSGSSGQEDPFLALLGLPTGIILRDGYPRGVIEDPLDEVRTDLRSRRTMAIDAGDNPWITSVEIGSKIVDPARGLGSLIGKHGPGATADGLRGNAKFDMRSWPLRLEAVFPYGDYALPSWRHYDQLDRVQFLDPGAEIPVKVIAVPKTDKSPRIIASEPTAVQYMQQAISSQLVNCLEKSRQVDPPFGGKACDFGRWYVGFRDQEPNRLLALKGSLDGGLATLDLSEASDRVLNGHVELLFSRFPALSAGIQATRSLKARVLGHGVIPLTKFSSMGSALCFPVEAMVFTTIVFVAIARQRRVPLDRKLLTELRGQVRVFGDDIVVPVDCVQEVIHLLEVFGLKVNRDKSFWNGKFRESCGGDYYEGEWVTPIRLRKSLPRSLRDVEGVVGLAKFRNLLYHEGYWMTARWLDEHLEVLSRGHWGAIVASTTAGLGRESIPFGFGLWGYDFRTHTYLVKGMRVTAKIPKSKASGTGALLKFFIKRGIVPSQDAKHLERQGRPKSSRIILGGIRPY